MRVYEIAKEVGIPNKDLIAKIRALGLEVNNHMSSVGPDDYARIKRSLEKDKAAVTSPAQTMKLSSGTVLRRRSANDKASDVSVAVGTTVKVTPLLATPPTVTVTLPVVAPLGTGTTMLVADQDVGVERGHVIIHIETERSDLGDEVLVGKPHLFRNLIDAHLRSGRPSLP